MKIRVSFYSVLAITYVVLLIGISVGQLGDNGTFVYDSTNVLKIFLAVTIPTIIGYFAGREDKEFRMKEEFHFIKK